MLDLEPIKKLCDGVTPGPWERYAYIGQSGLTRVRAIFLRDNANWVMSVKVPANPEDAKFIAESRELIPLLVAEVERLRAENESLLRQVNSLITSCYYRTKAGKLHWKQGQYFGTSIADHTQPEAYLQAMDAIRRNAGIPSDEDAREDEEVSDDLASESSPNMTHPATRADFAALIVSMMLTGFKWEMLPNGDRGWRWDGYLRDAEMKELYQWIGNEPKQEQLEQMEAERKAEIDEAIQKTNERFGGALERLAE